MAATEFTIFSKLPSELRNQIWADALAGILAPPYLFFYAKGCYRLRLLEAGTSYEPHYAGLFVEISHDWPQRIRVDVPIASVNRESRSVALGWARTHGIEPNLDEHRHNFARRFKVGNNKAPVAQDVLYIPYDRWKDFWNEPEESTCDVCSRKGYLSSPVAQLAVHEKVLWDYTADLCFLASHLYNIDAMYVVIDAPKDLQIHGNNWNVQQRWELVNVGPVVRCDDTGLKIRPKHEDVDQPLAERIEKLYRVYREHGVKGQFVIAVKR